MFSRLKSYAASVIAPVVSVSKRILAPFSFSLGRVFSTAGSALFNIQYVLKYFNNNPPTARGNMIFEVIAMFSNVWTNLVLRVPLIFRQFRSSSAEENRPFIRGANTRQKSIYLFFKICGMAAGTYNSLSFYLGGITLAEFIAELCKSDAHDAEWKEALVQSAAVFFALSNLVSFYTYTLRSVEDNALRLGEHLDSDDKLEREAVVLSLLIATWGMVSGTMLGFFSYGRAFNDIKFLKIGNLLNKCLSGAGSFFSLTVSLLTQLPALYSKLRHATPEERIAARNTASQQQDTTTLMLLRRSTLAVGVIESASMGAQNGMGVINTSNELWGVDPYGYVIVPAGVCALSTTFSFYAFNILFGTDRAINVIREMQATDRSGYTVIPDVEAPAETVAVAPEVGSINNDPNPALRRETSPLRSLSLLAAPAQSEPLPVVASALSEPLPDHLSDAKHSP